MQFSTNDSAARLLESFREDNGDKVLSNLAMCWNEIYWSSRDDKRAHEHTEEGKYAGVALLTELVVRLNSPE